MCHSFTVFFRLAHAIALCSKYKCFLSYIVFCESVRYSKNAKTSILQNSVNSLLFFPAIKLRQGEQHSEKNTFAYKSFAGSKLKMYFQATVLVVVSADWPHTKRRPCHPHSTLTPLTYHPTTTPIIGDGHLFSGSHFFLKFVSA